MEVKYLEEKLNSIRNEMSHIWGGIFVTGGGSVTLATTGYDITRLIFIIIGIWLAILFINAYFIRKQELMNILNELKMEGNK